MTLVCSLHLKICLTWIPDHHCPQWGEQNYVKDQSDLASRKVKLSASALFRKASGKRKSNRGILDSIGCLTFQPRYVPPAPSRSACFDANITVGFAGGFFAIPVVEYNHCH